MKYISTPLNCQKHVAKSWKHLNVFLLIFRKKIFNNCTVFLDFLSDMKKIIINYRDLFSQNKLRTPNIVWYKKIMS